MPQLYDAKVMHARLCPKRHRFTHSAFAFFINANEIEKTTGGRFMLGYRWSPYRFRDKDFLPASEIFQPEEKVQKFGETGDILCDRFRAFAASHDEPLPPHAEIRLLAMPRSFGVSYNPVVFFLATVDGKLKCGAAEVHNTFGERKAWFLGYNCLTNDTDGATILRLRTNKNFYVSPFSGINTEFEFTIRLPHKKLAITVDHYEGGKKTLISTWVGEKVPLTDRNLLWLTIKSPLLVVKVILLIHLHAAWLWLCKKLPFHRKSEAISQQRNVRHPSTELTHRDA